MTTSQTGLEYLSQSLHKRQMPNPDYFHYSDKAIIVAKRPVTLDHCSGWCPLSKVVARGIGVSTCIVDICPQKLLGNNLGYKTIYCMSE